MKTCLNCKESFQVEEEDRIFYDKISPVFKNQKHSLPEPTHCPKCRQQRRLAWRNERTLYKRKCDLTGTDIMSIYNPEMPFKVYGNEAWYSDKWDPCQYGRDIDFNRPFFEQFQKLQQEVPRLALLSLDTENSLYVNQCWHVKNCYLSYDIGYCENIQYCYSTYHSSSCIDIMYGEKNELCYSTINSKNCYNCVFTQDCKDCSDTYFSFDCHNSRNLLFCENLKGKQYHIRNQKVSPDEFQQALQSLNLESYKNWTKALEEFQTRKKSALKRENRNVNVENCTGNDLFNCKNCHNCFECYKSEDAKYITRGDHEIKDCMDCDHLSEVELAYEGLTCSGYNNLFSYVSIGENTIYCDININSKNCFGCSNISKKEYCILNKQYSKEEYESLVPRIIEHMRSTGEWGEFFPYYLSPFGYNETLANQYYPLTKEAALSKGFHWSDYEAPFPQVEKTLPAEKLPDKTSEIPDDILNWAIICEITKKPFKITPQELTFYRDHKLPLPRKHPNQRFKERMELRTPREFWNHHCSKCRKEIISSYPPEEEKNILCAECYRETVY